MTPSSATTRSLTLPHHLSRSHLSTLNPSSSLPNPTLVGLDELTHHHLTPHIDPAIADDYDWSTSSASNYSVKYEPVDFVRYEYSKSLLDYSYHGYYTKQRQERVHNPIIDWYTAIALHKVECPHSLSLSL